MLTLQEISSLAILIPLTIAALKLKTGDLKTYLFFAFLLFGAVVDGLGFLAHKTNEIWPIHGNLLAIYIAFESLFFLWISSYFFEKKLRDLIRINLGSLFLSAFGIKFYMEFSSQPIIFTSRLSAICLIASAFISGFGLLRMTEQRVELFSYSWFWIVSGIFIYSFGTFFIEALKGTEIADKIWFVRNIINIIQYGFFTIGLILIKEKES